MLVQVKTFKLKNFKKSKYLVLGIILILSLLNVTFCFVRNDKQPNLNPMDPSLPKSSDSDITIITPINTTYVEPMNGYYPATYGFENDEDGNFPMGWIDDSTGVAYVNVVSEMAGHKKVLHYYSSLTSFSQTTTNLSSPQTTGSIEYYVYKDGGYKGFEIQLRNSTGDYALRIGIDYAADGKFIWRTSNSIFGEFGVGKFSFDTWFHIRIDFNLVTNKFDIYLDGVKEVDQEDFFYAINSLQYIAFFQTYGSFGGLWYLDALSFSWDPNYVVGENLYEGLLLSFGNSTTLDWIGYSLDGQANNSILGNATISMPEDGSHFIQIFGNGTLGTNYQSDVRYFSVNTGSPKVSITSPVEDEFYGVSPPNFEITVDKPNLNTTWYTFNNGATNTTFTGLSGTIAPTVWESILADDLILRFYANDSFGLEGYSEVSFKKDLNAPYLTIVQDDLTFTVTAVDGSGSGVNSINYRINGSAWMQYTTPFTLDYGRYNITTRAFDEVGNIGYGGLIINLREPDDPYVSPDWTMFIMTSVIIGGIGLVIVITLLIKKRK